MKETSTAQRYRWIAAGLYGVLFIYQAYITRAVLQEATLTNVPFTWLYAVLLVPAALAMAAFLFGGKAVVKEGVRRAAVVVTAGCILFEWLNYSDQTSLINYTLYRNGSAMYNQGTALFLLVCARLVLLVLAAFMVMMSNPMQDEQPKGAVPEWVDEMEKERLAAIRAKKTGEEPNQKETGGDAEKMDDKEHKQKAAKPGKE